MKITQYQREKLSPQAVGAPSRDRSGEILARGVVALGEAISDREDTTSKLEASKTYGEYQFEYGSGKIALQKQYADKPLEYVGAVKKLSEDLTAKYGKGLRGKSYDHFSRLTKASLAQDADNLTAWAFQRDNEIQVQNITDIKSNIALRASTVTSADGLRSVLNDFGSASQEATKLIDQKSDAQLTQKYVDLAKKNAMFAQIYARPMQVYRDLEGGAYTGLLSPEEISEFTDKARRAIYNRAEDENYRMMYMAQGKLLDFQKGIDEGSVTITDLIAEREAAWAHKDEKDVLGKPVIEPDYIKGLDNLIDTVMYSKMRLPMNKDAAKIALDKFDQDWDAYLQAKKDANQQPNDKDIAKELSIYANLLDLYKSGVIMKHDFDEKAAVMRTKLALKKNQTPRVKSFSEVVDQAGTVQQFFWRSPGNDVVSLGYTMIKQYVDKSYVDPEVRRMMKAQMLAQYQQVIDNTPEETWKNLKTESERTAFARQKVLGVTGPKGEHIPGVAQSTIEYQDATGTYKIGSVKQEGGIARRLVGVENGVPKWQYVEGQIIPNSRGQKARVLADGSFEVIDNGK